MTNLIIKHNIKKALPKRMKVSGKVADALNKLIQQTLNKAAERAQENKRKTVTNIEFKEFLGLVDFMNFSYNPM